MARRKNQRVRRGDVMQSVCPGCEALINENMNVNTLMGRLETQRYYVVFCAQSAECYLAANELLHTQEKKFAYRRREL